MGLKVQLIPYNKVMKKTGNVAKTFSAMKAGSVALDVLNIAVQMAQTNYVEWESVVDKEHRRCKALLADAAGKVNDMESPDWIPSIYTQGEVQAIEFALERAFKALKKDNKVYSDASNDDGFRQLQLGKPIRDNFKQLDEEMIKGLVKKPGAERAAIIAANRGLTAKVARVGEYHTRAQLLSGRAEVVYKAAMGRGGNLTINSTLDDIDKNLKKINALLDKILPKIATRDKLMNMDPGETEAMLKGVDAELDENLQKCRGALKTLDRQIDVAAKRLAKAEAPPADKLIDAVREKQEAAKKKRNTLSQATKVLKFRRERPEDKPPPIPVNE